MCQLLKIVLAAVEVQFVVLAVAEAWLEVQLVVSVWVEALFAVEVWAEVLSEASVVPGAELPSLGQALAGWRQQGPQDPGTGTA